MLQISRQVRLGQEKRTLAVGGKIAPSSRLENDRTPRGVQFPGKRLQPHIVDLLHPVYIGLQRDNGPLPMAAPHIGDDKQGKKDEGEGKEDKRHEHPCIPDAQSIQQGTQHRLYRPEYVLDTRKHARSLLHHLTGRRTTLEGMCAAGEAGQSLAGAPDRAGELPDTPKHQRRTNPALSGNPENPAAISSRSVHNALRARLPRHDRRLDSNTIALSLRCARRLGQGNPSRRRSRRRTRRRAPPR